MTHKVRKKSVIDYIFDRKSFEIFLKDIFLVFKVKKNYLILSQLNIEYHELLCLFNKCFYHIPLLKF